MFKSLTSTKPCVVLGTQFEGGYQQSLKSQPNQPITALRTGQQSGNLGDCYKNKGKRYSLFSKVAYIKRDGSWSKLIDSYFEHGNRSCNFCHLKLHHKKGNHFSSKVNNDDDCHLITFTFSPFTNIEENWIHFPYVLFVTLSTRFISHDLSV